MSDQSASAASDAPVLEQMNVGMILDKAIHLYSRDFLLLVAITAIPQVLYGAGTWLMYAFSRGEGARALVGFPLLVLGAVFNGIGGGAMTVVVSTRYLGKDVTFAQAYGAALRRAGPLVGGSLLALLFIVLAMFGLIVPGLIFAVSYCLVSPVIMLENVKGAKSLKRSRRLMKGYRWQAFLLYLLYWVAVYVGILILVVIVMLIARSAFFVTWQRYSVTLITPVVSVLLGPLSSVISVLLYYGQMIRKESFDLAFLADAMAAHAR